jgi:hydrogenase nickel incorporation protein HypB
MIDILETKTNVQLDNDAEATKNRQILKQKEVFLINLMGSPGAGKTSCLKRIITALKDDYKIGVMEADMDSDVDARAIGQLGVKVIQLHTGGSCHMDADMTRRGLIKMGIDDLDLVILENVGNLVCPAEFDVGADLKIMILSSPEGDDKPLKYPLMFKISDCMLINKIDVKDIFDFDIEKATARAFDLNPNLKTFAVSAATGQGFEAFTNYLKQRIGERP